MLGFPAAQFPTALSLTGAGLIIVSTFSLGAFEKTHPVPSTSPDPSTRGGTALAADPDGLGGYAALPATDRPAQASL